MSDTRTDVLVAAYQDIDAATRDFDGLMQIVKDKQVEIEGAILVAHGEDGSISVVQHGDDLGRKGLGWGAGAGLVVGLFAPPLLASVVVGGAAGGLIGKFADRKVEAGMEELAEQLPPGKAGVITVFGDEHRLAIEQALAGSPAKSVAQTDKDGVRALKAELATAMGKFAQDRSELPIPDRTFGGTVGRTLKESVADWSMIPGPKAPEGAPNVLLVIVDDAGFGSVDTFGGPVSSPAFSRVQEMGATYNQFHVTAVCSPTRAALLTGRNQHRVGFGSIAEYPGPVPRLHGRQAEELRGAAPNPQGERLRHRRLREVAPHAQQRAGHGGPLRSLAEVMGVRPLVGLPVGRGRSVRPDHHAGRRRARGARG